MTNAFSYKSLFALTQSIINCYIKNNIWKNHVLTIMFLIFINLKLAYLLIGWIFLLVFSAFCFLSFKSVGDLKY